MSDKTSNLVADAVEPYLQALTRYIDGVYSMAMEYRVPAKYAAFHAKHMQDAVLGIRRILQSSGETPSPLVQVIDALTGELESIREFLGRLVAADDGAMAEMRAIGLEPSAKTRALTDEARKFISSPPKTSPDIPLASNPESLAALVREAIDKMNGWEYDDMRNWSARAEVALSGETTDAEPPKSCGHARSELLAEKQTDGEPLFQMRKCLDCRLIFRVRSSVKKSAPQCRVVAYSGRCALPPGHPGEHSFGSSPKTSGGAVMSCTGFPTCAQSRSAAADRDSAEGKLARAIAFLQDIANMGSQRIVGAETAAHALAQLGVPRERDKPPESPARGCSNGCSPGWCTGACARPRRKGPSI